MFNKCNNCGKEFVKYDYTQDYCPACGVYTGLNKLRRIINIIKYTVMVLTLCFMIYAVSYSMNQTNSLEKFSFGDDEIQTVYSINGIKSYSVEKSEETNSLTINYKSNKLLEKDIKEYENYLSNNGYYKVEGYNYFMYVKESSTKGYIIVIKGYYSNDNNLFSIYYECLYGSIDDYI